MRLKRTGILTKIVIAVVLIYALVSLIGQSDRISGAKADLADLKKQEADLAAENDHLRDAIENSTDERIIEELAREEGYSYPNEEKYYVGNQADQ